MQCICLVLRSVVQLHALQLSFSFLQRPLPWVLYMRVVLTCLWKNLMNIVLICSGTNAMYCDILSVKCSEFLHVFKPGVFALWFDVYECGVITLLPLCIWRVDSCMMVSHVGPRAGCGCCMPCEVVACIVVLPMPVDSLMVFLCRIEVDIYILGFGEILPNFVHVEFVFTFVDFPWICIDLSRCVRLHDTVM